MNTVAHMTPKHRLDPYITRLYVSDRGTFVSKGDESAVRMSLSIRVQIRKNSWSDSTLEIQRGDRSLAEMDREANNYVSFARAAYEQGSRHRAQDINKALDENRN